MINNLKQIRELYGATQEQVAQAINVNRVTVANWESGASKASSSNQEKLSIYYGIGPEFFYEKDLSDEAKNLIIATGEESKRIAKTSNGQHSKEETFHKLFESLTFQQAMEHYMFSMKMLLATADSGLLDKLETVALINEKMGERLRAIIKLRQDEEASNKPTLFDLIEKVENSK